MKLTKNNIEFVKCMKKDGVIYFYFVKLKDGETKHFINIENNITVAKEFSEERLPISVRKFIDSRSQQIFSTQTYKESEYTTLIWK